MDKKELSEFRKIHTTFAIISKPVILSNNLPKE